MTRCQWHTGPDLIDGYFPRTEHLENQGKCRCAALEECGKRMFEKQCCKANDEAIFRKPDMKVRVGIKETEDPVPLCYGFDYTREDILREIHKTGETKLAEIIKGEVQDGFCACEVKNPSGSCCLGDITRAIQQAKLLRAEPRREHTTANHNS